MGIFTILLSALISAGLVLVFRYLDKDNNSMGKVRQYADKRLNDFDDYFKNKNHQLMTTSAELDAKQTMSVAAVKRFEKDLSEFKGMIEGLTHDTTTVKLLEQKSAAYEEQLSKLIDMSTHVEENLLNIQKASSIIDQTNARFEAQKKNVEAIEKKVNSITQEFSHKNADQLKAIATELLNQYNSRAQKIEEITSSAQKRTEELVQKINSDIASAYSAAGQKATQIESSVLANLNEKAQERCNSYKTSLEEKTAEIAKEIEAKSASLKETLAQVEATIAQNTAELSKEAAGNGKSLEGIRASLESQIAELQTHYNSLFEKSISDADAKESAAYEKYLSLSQQHLESYKSAVQEKINSLQESITQTINTLNTQTNTVERTANEKLSAMTKSLSSLDERLDDYKKDITYRLSALESSDKDIDSLEKAIRDAMDTTQKNVLADFEKFSTEQQNRQTSFETSIKDNSEKISAELESLEHAMDDLKDSAITSVSEKLQGMENSFDSNLEKSNAHLTSELDSWKQGFNNRLNEISSKFEDERTSIETQYTEDFKNKISSMQEKSKELFAKNADELSENRENVNLQLNQVKNDLSAFMDQYRNNLEQASINSEKALKDASDAYNARIVEQLEKKEKEILEDLKAFEDTVTTRQQTSVSTIDASLSDFNIWKQHLRQQLDESRSLFEEQLEGMRTTATQKIDEAQKDLSNSMEAYSSDNQKKFDDLLGQIESLKDKSDESVAGYEDRANHILTQLQQMYEDMLKTTEDRVRTQNADSEQKLRDLKSEIQNAQDESRARQANLVLKMQNDSNDFQSRMSELDKELKSIESQIHLYEKADQMKKQLDQRLADLENSFNKVDLYRGDAEKLSAEYASLAKLDSEMNDKMARFTAGRSQIENIESKFDKLINLSSTMDEKIKDLQTTSDDLQELQISVRNFQNTLSNISDRYDRLEKKNDVIDNVSANVDKTFENLRDIEQRLTSCTRQVTSLPSEIADVQKNVDSILSNNERINQAIEKLESLQGLLSDADKKVDEIKSERQGIGRSETRLQQLSKDIDNKFALLAKLTKADIEKNPAKQSTGITPQDREDIKSLKRQGWTVSEIARRMNHSETEIELILDMPND